MGTGLLGAYRRLDPNRLPFRPASEMTKIEMQGFQHAISRHGQDFGLKWTKKDFPKLVEKFNSLASEIRKEGGFMGYQSIQYGVRGSGKPSVSIQARTFEMVKNGQTYYYYETKGGRFISAGLKTTQ